jgi:hypothetical protein
VNVPYALRLLCLCMAAFFVIHTGAGLAVAALTPLAMRAVQRMRARRAVALLFALRLLPVTLAIFLVSALCVPSYLLLEEEGSIEKVGPLCLVLAGLAACLWGGSVLRSLRAAALSMRQSRDWERTGSLRRLSGARQPVCVVDCGRPLLALAGVFHSRLIVSQEVAGALSTEQLCAALRHEEAHRTQRDNLKRLMLLLSPGLLPGWSGFRALERDWFRLTEWAADDDAVAGNTSLSLSLAAALVCLARMGGTLPPSPLSVTFLADPRELSARVDRLLRPAEPPPASPRVRAAAITAMLGAVGGSMALALQPDTLESAHQIMEHLIR